MDVNVANSIDNRLTKLLQSLTLHYPDEGWDRFLLRDKPKWSQIAVSGHSGGGGNAAMIAKIRLVVRVVLFSSVTDSMHAEAPSWLATHLTPVERYYGIAHDRDVFYRPIRAGWDSLGLRVFGAPATPETSSPPYDGTHTLDRSEEHTSELQSLAYLVCRLLLEKKKKTHTSLSAPRRQTPPLLQSNDSVSQRHRLPQY